MQKYRQVLTVLFDTISKSSLYSGTCYYRKNLSDHISISQNSIVITFERTKKDNPEELLNTQNSILRYYLQKALCFYLSVEGSIPGVKDITFTCNNKTSVVEHERFTKNWNNCKVWTCLDPEAARIIFEGPEGKPFYIIMSHFLKAQLDHFSHDRFRSSWSCLNGLYTYLDGLHNEGYRSEQKKISSLLQIIDDNELPESLTKIESLDDDTFWKRLNWYCILNSYSMGEFRQLQSGKYSDAMLIGLLCRHRAVFAEEIKSDDDVWDKLQQKSEERKAVPKDRLKFLVCKYCYQVRNKSFHAERAYPLFIISEDIETGIEKTLTEILLLLVKELFEVYAGKAR